MKKEANVKGHVRRTLKGKSYIVKQYKKKINLKDKKEQSEKLKKIALGTILGLGVAGAGLTAAKLYKTIKLNGLQDELGNPKIYSLFGSSSGGKQATEAAHILKAAGISEENIRVITYGGESTPGIESFKNSLHIRDSADNLVKKDPYYTDNILDPKIDWPKKYPEVSGTFMEGHYPSALVKETSNTVKDFTSPPKITAQKSKGTPKLIKQQQILDKFKTDLNKLQNNDKLPKDKKQQLIQDLNDKIQRLQNEINEGKFRKCNYLISNFSITKQCKYNNAIHNFRIYKKKNSIKT